MKKQLYELEVKILKEVESERREASVNISWVNNYKSQGISLNLVDDYIYLTFDDEIEFKDMVLYLDDISYSLTNVMFDEPRAPKEAISVTAEITADSQARPEDLAEIVKLNKKLKGLDSVSRYISSNRHPKISKHENLYYDIETRTYKFKS